jgi:hypothetical protein
MTARVHRGDEQGDERLNASSIRVEFRVRLDPAAAMTPTRPWIPNES